MGGTWGGRGGPVAPRDFAGGLPGCKEKDSQRYGLYLPGRKHGKESRTEIRVPANNIYEIVYEESENTTYRHILRERIDELPLCYHQNKIVRERPRATVQPYAIYFDGVSYSNNDTVTGLWLGGLVLSSVSFIAEIIIKRLQRNDQL